MIFSPEKYKTGKAAQDNTLHPTGIKGFSVVFT